ncbi:hypothetical protein [Micromonospora sp. WMMD1082]|uniref:hypothetical protein n=1 Tax=Micromonospora sp. WMMD1082 TaxID=3016104 RepID=UPI002416D939|nr:hypothetical protein [Micromonospora sp. WMMD1082]MDG4794536.1 hypothetical protein [Micromonospora sp. WMMD1082]
MVDVTGTPDRSPAAGPDAAAPPAPDRPAGLAHRAARRWPTLVAIAILSLLLVAGAVEDFADGLAWAAVLYVMIGAIRGHLRRVRMLAVQLAGVLVFGGLALFAAVLDQPWAAYLLAIGWLGHAVWDAFHLRANVVVPRWYAEACVVLDVLLVVAILALA